MSADTSKKIVIAVDGYSSCGKSTLAKQLSQTLNYIHIDTGAMYRSVALYFSEHSINLLDHEAVAQALQQIHIRFKFSEDRSYATLLNNRDVSADIRLPKVSNIVSEVAAMKEVRSHLFAQQRAMGDEKGVVMDGRDIGTVIFPDAELKIFVTADIDIRSERRRLELVSHGNELDFETVKTNLMKRDSIDQNREVAPLKKADDAIVLDTSYLTRDEQLQEALQMVEDVISTM